MSFLALRVDLGEALLLVDSEMEFEQLHRRRPQIALSRACFKNWQGIANNEGRQAGEARRQRQPRAAQNGDYEERQMKGDKAAAASRPFRDFGNQQPSL